MPPYSPEALAAALADIRSAPPYLVATAVERHKNHLPIFWKILNCESLLLGYRVGFTGVRQAYWHAVYLDGETVSMEHASTTGTEGAMRDAAVALALQTGTAVFGAWGARLAKARDVPALAAHATIVTRGATEHIWEHCGAAGYGDPCPADLLRHTFPPRLLNREPGRLLVVKAAFPPKTKR